jgi:hypothetical protein
MFLNESFKALNWSVLGLIIIIIIIIIIMDYPPHLEPRLKKELYLYSPSVPSWQVVG